MNSREQGVLPLDKQVSLLGKLLLLIALILSQAISAETIPIDPVSAGISSSDTAFSKPTASIAVTSKTTTSKASIAKAVANATQTDIDVLAEKHVFIIYPSHNALLSGIGDTLASNLRLTYPDIIISKSTAEDGFLKPDKKPDIVISIGAEKSYLANRYFPNTNKLFISTSPGKFRPEIVGPDAVATEAVNPATDNPEIVRTDINTDNNAVLYMTQPYCRQIKFIKLINNDWNVVSLLNSQISIMNTGDLQQCAKKYNLETKIVRIISDGKLTDGLKNALNHSDVLLALPDNNIYNSRTVKNILLTSYRHRKPVIAFSKNFVSAGALAAIYSSTQQIGDSSSNLVELFFEHGRQFEKPINYPREFNISINKQVFTALDIAIPDLDSLKQNLNLPEKTELLK